MERLITLFEHKYGARPTSVQPLTGSASPRLYFRMEGENGNCVGVIGTDLRENRAFVAIAGKFRSSGIPVPEVYEMSLDGMAYIQEDLGSDVLFDLYSQAVRSETSMQEVEQTLMTTVAYLPKIQFEVASDFDFSVCHPQQTFSLRSVLFDLNYFKYCFLKPTGLEFDEVLLQDDFERFAEDLAGCGLPYAEGVKGEEVPTFLYRDCQARNVMIREGQPYFIDFQAGRRGPIYYDVASFIWHPRASYSRELKERMLDAYLESLSVYMEVDRKVFMAGLRLFLLFRYLQILGAYGFRGLVEGKANFVVCIPEALRSLSELIEDSFERYPYLMKVLKDMTDLPRFADENALNDGKLHVKVYSFSFKKGIPHDPSGNGGGYVFDCRSIHNPGRYEQYKKLTGRDEPVIRFLEEDGEITSFLENVCSMVDPHVETYINRGFTSFMVSFGCTGGQHRSVYCAESLAHHLKSRFPEVRVQLIHREQGINQIIDC